MSNGGNYPKVYLLSKFKGKPGEQLGACLWALNNRALCIDNFLRIYDELGEKVNTLCLGDQLTLILIYSDIIPDDDKRSIIQCASKIFEENWWIPDKEKNTDEAKKEKKKILSILKNFYNFSEALTLEEVLNMIIHIIYGIKIGEPFAQPTDGWSYMPESIEYDRYMMDRKFESIININIPQLLINYMLDEIERVTTKKPKIPFISGYNDYEIYECKKRYNRLQYQQFAQKYGLPPELPGKLESKEEFQIFLSFYDKYKARRVNILDGINVIIDETSAPIVFEEDGYEDRAAKTLDNIKAIYLECLKKEADLNSHIDDLAGEITDRIISHFMTRRQNILQVVTKNPDENAKGKLFRKSELRISRNELWIYLVNIYKEKYNENNEKVIYGLWAIVKKRLVSFCNSWYIPIKLSEDGECITMGTQEIDIETQKNSTYVYTEEANFGRMFSLLNQRRILMNNSCRCNPKTLLDPLKEALKRIGCTELVDNIQTLMQNPFLPQPFKNQKVNIEVVLPANESIIAYYRMLLNTSYITNPPTNFMADRDEAYKDGKPIEPKITQQALRGKYIYESKLPEDRVCIFAFEVNLYQLLLSYGEELNRLQTETADDMSEVKSKLLEPVENSTITS